MLLNHGIGGKIEMFIKLGNGFKSKREMRFWYDLIYTDLVLYFERKKR